MYIIFGIEVLTGYQSYWPSVSAGDFILVFLFIVLVIAFIFLIRYNLSLKEKKLNAQQLFLFKAKQLGLSNFQYKILNGIINLLSLSDPNRILNNAALYESSFSRFFDYLKTINETRDSVINIGKDLIITYEKIYHPSKYKKQIESIAGFEVNSLVGVITPENEILITKLLNNSPDEFKLEILHHHTADASYNGRQVRLFIWRAGDAEYTIVARISSIEGNFINISSAESIERGREARHPYIEVMVPCVLKSESDNGAPSSDDDEQQYTCSIFKMNENEAVLRSSQILDYKTQYYLEYTISDFKIRIKTKILSDRTIHEQNVHYYTLKYLEISKAAHNILKQYIIEHLE
jgi:hypothetical protein